ncbi:hypothetical protein ACWGKS_22500 [Nocardiopsis sp. NPDC055879]
MSVSLVIGVVLVLGCLGKVLMSWPMLCGRGTGRSQEELRP